MDLENLIDGLLKFSAENRMNCGEFALGNHQLGPVYDMVANGMKRMVLAYGTGAGKTVVPLEITRSLPTGSKTLLIAPKQTIPNSWSEKELSKHGIDRHYHEIKKGSRIPGKADFVVINKDKLLPNLEYFEEILNYAKVCDLVVVDETHNMRNRSGKMSQQFQIIMDATKDKRFLGLTATPIYNTPKDLGMILYAIDPERYSHYIDIGFCLKDDHQALWEVLEQGQLRVFSIEDVRNFYNLPEFTEADPIDIDMSKEEVKAYLDAYTRGFQLGDLHELQRISINSVLNSPKTVENLAAFIQAGYAINIFSPLVNEKGDEQRMLFSKIEDVLKKAGAKTVAQIHGGNSGDKDHLKSVQKQMKEGRLDVLINQWDCTSEGFSEVAGDRPVLIFPLRSPFTPGRYFQIIGRSYRPKQRAPVIYQEFNSTSEELKNKIDDFVRKNAKEEGLKVSTSWVASTFHEDCHNIRLSKQVKSEYAFISRGISETPEDLVSSIASYAKILSKDRKLVRKGSNIKGFGKGVILVGDTIGQTYDGVSGLSSKANLLGDDYNRADILLYVPGKINRFLAERVLEGRTKTQEIADLGCCSSAPFAQAYLLAQAVNEIPFKEWDSITNIDGQLGFLSCAKNLLSEQEWLDYAKLIEGSENAAEILKKVSYMEKLKFIQKNFVKDFLEGPYDVIIASQCLQYNDQNHNRDIESIVLNCNKSLRKGGNLHLALTANSIRNPSTTAKDLDGLQKILSAYGFKIEELDEFVEGERAKKFDVAPFRYIRAIKESSKKSLILQKPDVIVYTPKQRALTGGKKVERIVPVYEK